IDPIDALKTIIGSPNYGSRHWVFEQYDTTVMADTLERPGSEAGIVRVHGTDKAVAFTSDVTPRYCRANPFEGGKQAVAEAYRNLCASGAKPLAATDNLNFGNPEKPEIMGQFVGCIKGIGEACSALDMPIVSGNVSLYNETDGQAILPTPTIGGVGLIASGQTPLGMSGNDDDALVLLGGIGAHLGQSALLKECFDREDGDAPHVDLALERKAGELVLQAHGDGILSGAHDLSDGGLAVAVAEICMASGTGAVLKTDHIAALFGEDQGRYVLMVPKANVADVMTLADAAALPCEEIGTLGGDAVQFSESSVALDSLTTLYRDALPKRFN
ncbi:MAG: AIR synthase related protein, partial [Pseudomonadota bacterium]